MQGILQKIFDPRRLIFYIFSNIGFGIVSLRLQVFQSNKENKKYVYKKGFS